MARGDQAREQLRTIARLSQLVSSSLDVDRAFRGIADAVIALLEVPGVFFWMAHERERTFDLRLVVPDEMRTGMPRTAMTYDEGVVGWVARERRMLHVPDVYADDRVLSRDWWKLHRITSVLLVPIVVDEALLGVLAIVARTPFREEDAALAEGLAAHAAAALRNAAALTRSEARRQEAEALAEVGRLLSQTLDPESVGQRVTESVCRLLDARSAIIYRVGADGTLVAETISSAAEFPWIVRLGHGAGIAGLALRERKPVASSDILADPRLTYASDQRPKFEMTAHRALLAVPLVAQGREYGVLAVGDDTGRSFDDDDMRLTQAFADQAAIAIHNARLFADEQAAVRALRESEAVLQRALDVGQIGSWTSGVGPAARLGGARGGVRFLGSLPRGPPRPPPVFSPSFLPDDARAIEVARDAAPRGGPPSPPPLRCGAGGGSVGRDGRGGGGAGRARRPRPPLRGVGGDMGGRKKGEKGLQAAEEQLRQSQKMDAIGRLAGGVAHDFNNMLSVITGRSELLLRNTALAPPLRRDIDLIHRTADRAASLTRQLLAFSRKQVLQPKVLDLNTVVANMGRMLRRVIGEDIDLVIVARPGLARVNADPGQLEQVILNLAVNARDAMPGGGRLTIETAQTDLDAEYARRHTGVNPGRHVMLAVTDTGVGMEPAVRERIFEPFFTTKEVGKGTGLGLSTVYGIVQQSGGAIWVYSEPGQGTTFKIYLPSVDEPAEADQAPEEPPRGGSETVLLCEDEPDLRELTREVLEEFGYRVLEAADGRHALEVSAGHTGPIHLLLTDVVMPRMNGSDLAAQLTRERPLRVLYMSGYTETSVVRRGDVPGAAFLQKPFSPTALARTVREVLDRSG